MCVQVFQAKKCSLPCNKIVAKYLGNEKGIMQRASKLKFKRKLFPPNSRGTDAKDCSNLVPGVCHPWRMEHGFQTSQIKGKLIHNIKECYGLKKNEVFKTIP